MQPYNPQITPPSTQKVAGYKANYAQNYTPQQMDLFSQMLGLAGPGGDLYKQASGDPSYYQGKENQALQQFGSLQGNMANKFSGMGTGGRQSSGFQNTMTQGAQDFASSLSAQRSDMQNQALQQLSSMTQGLLGNSPYQMQLSKKNKKPSFWEQLLGGAAPLAGAGLGFAFGGWPGAQLGGSLGSSFGEAFR